MLLSQICSRLPLKCNILHNIFKETGRTYAKTILGALTGKSKLLGGALEKKRKLLDVETDPGKLVTHCCGSNIYKEGEDVRLGADTEYPDWLWSLRLGPPPPLHEMNPETIEYWERLIFLQHVRKLRLKKIKQKKKLYVNKGDQIYKLRQLRFRALAHKYDPGFTKPPQFDKEGWRII